MNRVCLGSSIIDEKEVNHWGDSPDGHTREVIEHADILFLISSKGVPRHCTTSVNRGDTANRFPVSTTNAPAASQQHALSFPIVMFATIFFNTVFRFVNFLSFVSAACSSWRNSWTHTVSFRCRKETHRLYAHLNLSALEELCILAHISSVALRWPKMNLSSVVAVVDGESHMSSERIPEPRSG